MRKLFCLFYAVVVCALFGCDDTYTEIVRYQVNEPVFMPAAEFRSSVKVTTVPHEITQQGKICFYEGYLYVSEPNKGIHIIDNRNPSLPKSIGFIELLGNADLSIRNNILYADSYIDLVWFDISNPALPVLRSRLEGAFKYALPPMDNGFGCDAQLCYGAAAEAKGVIVGWTLEERKVEVKHYKGEDLAYSDMVMNSSGGDGGSGVNGSMSRFCLYQNYLYTVMNDHISIFDLSGAEPVKVAEDLTLGWNAVETIFSYKDCLFMGTPRGMLIYSVKDPLKPERQSEIWHVFGCDPVVVENDIAYVTVHSGNMCGQNNNELLIINVSDVKSPKLIVSYTMTKPKGLGIDNGTLFVCDDGLKVFDAKDPQTIMANKLAHYSGMEGYDVIPHNNVLMMIAEDGIYQYDYSDVKGINQLSKLAITGK